MAASLGIWRSWSLSVGTMIGSGIFLLPAVLAPYGSVSLLGWLVAALGGLCITLCLAGLAARMPRIGGPYAWVRQAFGDTPAFLVAWGYWVSIWVAMAAVAVAFAGYLVVLLPAGWHFPGQEPVLALLALWAAVLVNLLGVRTAGSLLLVLTLLRIVPLVLIGIAGLVFGDLSNLQPGNPDQLSPLVLVASVAMLVMWAFVGMEAASIPADDTLDAGRTIPRALVAGLLSATVVYVLATVGVLALVPAATLVTSTAPFADAAAGVAGPLAAGLVAMGALTAMAGGLNANTLLVGQMPLALARDGLLPAVLARRGRTGVPAGAVLAGAVLASLVLLVNYSKTLVAAFTTMILLSTLMVLLPYVGSALASLRFALVARRAGQAVPLARLLAAFGTLAFCGLFVAGTGNAELVYGAALLLLGLVVHLLIQRFRRPPA